jgi:CheY-like chemotaxis protein
MKTKDLLEARREKKRPLVLIIDENRTHQCLYDLAKDEVEMIPYIAGSSEEGIEAAKSVKFDLIILDMQLPDPAGVEYLRKLQELDQDRGSRTPTMAVTAHAMPGDCEKCINAGVDDYLAKPFALAELKKKISILAA